MTKLPDTLRVGPFVYTIVADQAAIDRCGQESGANLDGQTNPSAQHITLRPDMPRDLEADTLLHEVLHVALNHAGLASAVLESHDLEEQLVNALSPWLLGILRDNPQLVAHLTTIASS